MKAIILGLLVFVATIAITGCAVTYQPAPYEEQLWTLARAHGYEQAFHTHVRGYGMCAAILVSGTGTNRFSAEINAYRRGSKFFNPSIGNIPVIGDIMINEREVITVKKKYSRWEVTIGEWRVLSFLHCIKYHNKGEVLPTSPFTIFPQRTETVYISGAF